MLISCTAMLSFIWLSLTCFSNIAVSIMSIGLQSLSLHLHLELSCFQYYLDSILQLFWANINATSKSNFTDKKMVLVLHKTKTSIVNPCHVTGLFLYPLKLPGNQRFFHVSRGYRRRLVAMKWFNRSNFHIRRRHTPEVLTRWRCLKKVLLNIWHNSQKNTCDRHLWKHFFLQLYKKESLTPGVSLWILRHF